MRRDRWRARSSWGDVLAASAALAAMVLTACGGRAPELPPSGEVPAAVLDRMLAETERRTADDRVAARVLLTALERTKASAAGPSSEDRHLVLTAWMSDAIQGGRIEEAHAAWRLLARDFDGTARFPTGARADRAAVAAGLLEAAADETRNRMEGLAPDPAAAARAASVAQAAREVAQDPEAAERFDRVLRWTSLASLREAEPALPPHAGPRVVVWADDYALGDPVLLSVLNRWAREGAEAGLRVGVVPVWRGQVREGLRRVRAGVEQERASLAARLAGGGPVREGEGASGADTARRLGLADPEVGLVLVDREGRIVARASGATLDPRPLDPALQRLVSR